MENDVDRTEYSMFKQVYVPEIEIVFENFQEMVKFRSKITLKIMVKVMDSHVISKAQKRLLLFCS